MRIISILMVMSVACGFFYGVEEKLYLFRLRNIDVVPENVLIEKETASLISRSSARFWPLLFIGYPSWKMEMEKKYPVRSLIRVDGWGEVVIEWLCLQPIFIVNWHNERWFITSNGMTWHESNPLWSEANPDVHNLLTLKWHNSMPPLVPDEANPNGVRQSIFPVVRTIELVEAIRKTPWIQKIKALELIKIAGELAVMVEVASLDKDVSILFEFSESTWNDLAPALETIVKSSDAKALYLDATYKDKIVIRNK